MVCKVMEGLRVAEADALEGFCSTCLIRKKARYAELWREAQREQELHECSVCQPERRAA